MPDQTSDPASKAPADPAALNGTPAPAGEPLPPEAVGVAPAASPVPRRPSAVARGFSLFNALWAYFGQDAMPRMAAALSYRTIFSLIPLLLVGFVMFRLFGDTESLVQRMLTRLMDQTGLSAIAVNQENAGQWIQRIVNGFQGINFGAIGLVSAATLTYAAMSLLVDIESSFNQVYNAAAARSWTKRLPRYWFMITAGPLALSGSVVAGEWFASRATDLAMLGPDALTGPWLVKLIGYLITIAINTLLMLTLYVLVPNTLVRWKPALLGAAVAGVLLEIGKYAFRWYIGSIVNPYAAENAANFVGPPKSLMLGGTGYTALYGTLALIPLLMLWIYITWFIVLFGLRVAFLLQHGRSGVLLAALRMQTVRRGVGTMWVDPARAVEVMLGVARGFADGKAVPLSRLARDADLDEPAIQSLMERLEDSGLVHRIGATGREDTFVLARPAEQVTIAEVVAVGQEMTGAGRGRSNDLVDRIRVAQLQAVQHVTLASLMPAAGRPGAQATTAATPGPPPSRTLAPNP